MRQKIITEAADADLNHIYEYLFERTPSSAKLFYNMALSTFADFPDDFWAPPLIATDLPTETPVHVLHLGSPFRAYTLYITMTDDAVYLLSAFAPGLSDEHKAARRNEGLKEIE